MTIRGFKQGDVLFYPYRWKYQPPSKQENPKDRPACVALILKNIHGNDVITLLPISDQQPLDQASALELTGAECVAIGLSESRRAFIHMSEANVDDIANSITLSPKTRVIGRLPQSTLKRMLTRLKMQLLSKNIDLIQRGKHG
jgi:hypothetical protein